ncbi:unnamed protein product [Sphagnum tenellum]
MEKAGGDKNVAAAFFDRQIGDDSLSLCSADRPTPYTLRMYDALQSEIALAPMQVDQSRTPNEGWQAPPLTAKSDVLDSEKRDERKKSVNSRRSLSAQASERTSSSSVISPR